MCLPIDIVHSVQPGVLHAYTELRSSIQINFALDNVPSSIPYFTLFCELAQPTDPTIGRSLLLNFLFVSFLIHMSVGDFRPW